MSASQEDITFVVVLSVIVGRFPVMPAVEFIFTFALFGFVLWIAVGLNGSGVNSELDFSRDGSCFNTHLAGQLPELFPEAEFSHDIVEVIDDPVRGDRINFDDFASAAA